MDFLRLLDPLLLTAVLALVFLHGWQARVPWFAAWIAARLLRSTVTVFLPYPSHRYTLVYAYTQPVLLLLLLLVVWEVIEIVLAQYRDATRELRQVRTWTYGLAALLSIALMMIDFGELCERPQWMMGIFAASRYVSWISVVALCCVSLWQRLFPVPMLAALNNHRRILLVYALLVAIAFHFTELRSVRAGTVAAWVSQIAQLLSCAAWCWCWRRSSSSVEAPEERAADRLSPVAIGYRRTRALVKNAFGRP
jgi:hypothetical protein